MPYTTDTVHHGSVRFCALPLGPSNWHHAFLLPWNGGGISLLDSTGAHRMHKIAFDPTATGAYTVDLNDCRVNGVDHQIMPNLITFDAYAYDVAGVIKIEFWNPSVITSTIDTYGYSTLIGVPTRMCIGRLARLHDGSLGYPGGPTCAMVCSYFQPEKMSLVKTIGGSVIGGAGWKELCANHEKLHFTCFGDGREPHVEFAGFVSNSNAGGSVYAVLSQNGAAPSMSNAGGGTSISANVPVQAYSQASGAGFGEIPTGIFSFGVWMQAFGGNGALPYTGTLRADIWM